MSNIYISIITLTKNDDLKFLKTLKSLKSQIRNFHIEWLIIDGSENSKQKSNSILIKNNFPEESDISINHVNSLMLNIKGIFPCMNHGKKISRGEFILFLNSGDTFFNDDSLLLLFKNSLDVDINKSLIFGQAKIIADGNINWNFPGERLTDIQKWLSFFEPNHQSMLISNKLAKKYDFPNNYSVISDGYWKRKILNEANDIVYIRKPVIKFFLDGVSSIKPSKKLMRDLINNKNINFIRKTIFFIKYLFPKRIFIIYYLIQKYKSIFIDFLI